MAKSFQDGIVILSPDFKLILAVISSSVMPLVMLFPAYVFAIYYTVICRYLSNILKNFLKTFGAITNPNYVVTLKQYLLIRKLVMEADSELSVLMFTSTLFNSCSLYVGITCLLHPGDYLSLGGISAMLAVWILFAISFTAFFVMSKTGSSIHELSSSIWDKVQQLIPAGQELTSSQKRLLSVVEKELTMTVWKVASVKRSFILATLGTVVTYSILVDNL
ncbi:uncharacterized protein CDAR_454081 [Caerostris darwini]|uniref:Uncharacterized protein n=1 Tax=Caerostris darwini TaxID=1538125 RepID=A0AAV4V6Q5_9ARAC|nr:uncharacterized protein CDAR_454081 [Caerostris darwini]